MTPQIPPGKRRLLLRGIRHLVAGEKHSRICGVDLLVADGRIQQIGPGIDFGQVDEVIDASTKLVLPGLVNTHHHMYQTLQRCVIGLQDAKLFDWLRGLYPIWRHLTAEVVEVSTKLACVELLKSGCTTSSDHHYVFPEQITEDLIAVQAAAAARTGIRFCATRGSMSRGESAGGLPPDSVVQTEDEILRSSEQLIASLHDPSPLSMCRVALAPCSPFSVTAELMQQTAQLARQHGVRLHTHLAETRDEQDYCLAQYGCRPLALMQQLDWLGDDVWYAHGIHFDDAELDLLASTATGVAHCPSSNMRLGSGICRVPEMRRRGVPVGLAVDGSASNDSSDMLGELRACLMLQRVLGGADAISATDVLDIATRGSARLLGWDDIGVIEEGKAADLILIELDRLDLAGAQQDPLAAVIFCGITHQVHTTIVNGEVVVRDGKLVALDEEELRDDANRLSRQMLEAEGHPTDWM